MLIHSSAQTTQETAIRWKRESKIAFVPTMGCLHEGHLALVKKARELAERVIVSIYVNPLQFGANEDFDKYPRTFEEDKEKLERLKVDLLFHPATKDLYPEGFATKIQIGDLTERLCGKFRPGHFDGVATVCLKLFEITQCDFAVFGEKDFQQLRVIQQLTRDLNLPVGIIPAPTMRDADGLALSSRNRYLSTEEREAALAIPRMLTKARDFVLTNGTAKVQDVLNVAQGELAPLKVQYLELTQGRNLLAADRDAYIHGISLPHLFVAAYCGKTRLIDNISLNGEHA